MKWYKVCNRISLLLHALCSAAGYFLIEAISRHSFSAAWTYMTTKPLIFAIRLCRRLSVRTKSMRKRIIRKGKTAGGKNREFIYGNRDRQKTAV